MSASVRRMVFFAWRFALQWMQVLRLRPWRSRAKSAMAHHQHLQAVQRVSSTPLASNRGATDFLTGIVSKDKAGQL